MREKKELKMNIGAGSIILILLIFALSTFAVLSIRASNNELKLAKKTAASVVEYYEADQKATELLAGIHEEMRRVPFEELVNQLSVVEEITQVFFTDGMVQVDYDIAVNEDVFLQVSLLGSENGDYQITKWKTVKADEGEYEIGIEAGELWDGVVE